MEFDYRLALMTGVDIPIPECQLTIKQPTCLEISQIGENKFNLGVQLLCIDKERYMQDEQSREELEKINNFQLLMMLINEDKEKKDDLKTILLMILPNYQIILTPRSILCKKGEENLIIDEENFESFQKILKKVFCQNRKKKDDDEIPEQYNVQSKKAKEIAEKLYKGRKRIAELKAAQNPDDSMLSRYISILAIGMGYTINELNSLTLYQIVDLFERFTMKMQQDVDLSIRLAGGTPDKQPKHWTEPLH